MKTIKNDPQLLLVFIFLLFFSNTIKSQDIILKLSNENQIHYSNEIWMDETNILYIDNETFDTKDIQNNRIQSIYFNQKTNYKIVTNRLFIEKVNCTIDSITADKVFYHKQDYKSIGLDKKEIIGIIFDKEYKDVVEFVKTIELKYLKLNHGKLKTISLVKNDGKSYQIETLKSIVLGKINVTVNVNGVHADSFIKVSETNSLQFWRKYPDSNINTNDSYILTNEKKWVKIPTINKIGKDVLNINIKYNDLVTNMDLLKSSITCLFFQDFSEILSLDSEIKENNNISNLGPIIFSFDIKPGFGYWFGINSLKGDKTTENYLKKLKTGFSLDINFNAYLKKVVGFGIKYNYFATKNSIDNLVEDNIKISFIAGTLALKSTFKNDKGNYNASFSIGQIKLNNSGEIYNVPQRIKGSTIGFYFAGGLDLLVSDYVSICCDTGLLLGVMDKAEFNGYEYKLDEPVIFSRVDLLLGLKFYF